MFVLLFLEQQSTVRYHRSIKSHVCFYLIFQIRIWSLTRAIDSAKILIVLVHFVLWVFLLQQKHRNK